MQLIDGKKIARELREEIAEEVSAMAASGKRVPHLAAVLVGKDPASETYVNAKVKACKAVGFNSTLVRLDETVSQQELLLEVDKLNNDPGIDGFIVQLPLPAHMDPKEVIERVSPDKDVDGFHPVNVGRMALGLPGFVPATPGGILELLKRYKIETDGKHCVVLGRSNIVGGPMSILMRQNAYPGNATVTIVHSRTKGIEDICHMADILIVAIGKPEYVTEDMVKKGAVVIDVGMNRLHDPTMERGYRLCGDVHFENVSPKCSYITPVPGGVGPMTIASLLNNTLIAAKRKA